MDSPGPAKQGSTSDVSHEPHIPESDSHKPPTSATTSNKDGGEKLEVLLKPVGDAPTLKNRKWTVPGDWSVRKVSDTVRNMLKLEAHESLVTITCAAFIIFFHSPQIFIFQIICS
jgi:hypothetical protein